MNPIMTKEEEGLVTSNGAEGPPSHVSIPIEQLASSSAPHDYGSASASSSPSDAPASASSSPSDAPSASRTACSRPPPTTTTVSGSNTTTSTTSGSAAPNTGTVAVRRSAGKQRREPQHRNDAEMQREDRNDAEGARRRTQRRAGPRDRNDAEIRREGPQDRNHADDGLFKLGEIFMGLCFQLGIALMIVRVQPNQGESSTNLSSLSSILFYTVGATTFSCFVFTMLGWFLREHHLEEAKIFTWIGIWSGVLAFFLMISIFTTA